MLQSSKSIEPKWYVKRLNVRKSNNGMATKDQYLLHTYADDMKRLDLSSHSAANICKVLYVGVQLCPSVNNRSSVRSRTKCKKRKNGKYYQRFSYQQEFMRVSPLFVPFKSHTHAHYLSQMLKYGWWPSDITGAFGSHCRRTRWTKKTVSIWSLCILIARSFVSLYENYVDKFITMRIRLVHGIIVCIASECGKRRNKKR